ncbi:MAG: N-formylglutamate amidohydrolase [Comamonadaceae bacterium]|nr:MAG: N-formylglutamate amidohydrolase [Comamonadaceae bacterium]
MRRDFVIVSCEHGGNEVPAEYAGLFAGHEALLATHRGWDLGALQLAREMAADLDAPLFAATTTRLLIDLNRSIGHGQLHSEVTRSLPLRARRELAAVHYTPYREKLEAEVAQQIGAGRRVVHIASHSFTPVLRGVVRDADLALLYDPARTGERAVAAQWLVALRQALPALRLRRNYPYEGKGDGVMSLLRKRHAEDAYVGIELEVNQRFVAEGGSAWDQLRQGIVDSLAAGALRN